MGCQSRHSPGTVVLCLLSSNVRTWSCLGRGELMPSRFRSRCDLPCVARYSITNYMRTTYSCTHVDTSEFLGFWGAPPPSLSGWSLFSQLTPRGYCRDFNIAVESGLVSGPPRSRIFIIRLRGTVPTLASCSIIGLQTDPNIYRDNLDMGRDCTEIMLPLIGIWGPYHSRRTLSHPAPTLVP